MKKKIPWKNILNTSVSLIAVAAIIVLFMAISGNSELETSDPEIITPVNFTATEKSAAGMQKIAENGKFILSADSAAGAVSLINKENGAVYLSSPEISEEEELKNNVIMQLGSLLSFEYSDRDSNAFNSQNSFAGSVKNGDFNVSAIENGIRFDFYFPKEGFLIPLEISLTENGIKASVPIADIKEESNRIYLTTVTVLPNFGAATAADDGYMLLPDGSGALADFSLRDFKYSQRIYGEDYAVMKNTSEKVSETARMPVFGIKRNDSAFLSVISSGAARAYVDAAAPTEKKPYATVSARFIYRELITVDVSQKTFESTQVNMFENSPCSAEAFSVDYRICEGSDYISMADSYRDYLKSEGTQSVSGERSALYIGLIGGAMCEQSRAGIPVKSVLPVTDFSDADSIISELNDNGISDLTINYLYWYKNGSQSRLTTDVKADSALGGDRGLKSLAEKYNNSKVSVFLDLNLTDMMNDRIGYMRKYSSAQTVRKEPLIQYEYLSSTFQRITDSDLRYLLSPALIKGAAEKAALRLEKFSVAGYSANGLSTKIYSDMGEREIDRGRAEEIWKDALKELSDKSRLLLAGANAYGFSESDVITDVPVYSSGYLMETCEIPFYSMVMHGLSYLSSGDINGYADTNSAFLKSLEAGIGLKYTLGAENVDRLYKTSISEYSYISANVWLPEAVKAYKAVGGYLSAVSDKLMTKHVIISDSVRYSEFENGLGVYVNYSDKDYVFGDVTVPAKGYIPVGW